MNSFHICRTGFPVAELMSWIAASASHNSGNLTSPLTAINLKVKIHRVEPLFVGDDYRTDVWISEQASEVLNKFLGKTKAKGKEFIAKVAHYAKSGFENFQHSRGPIRHEGNRVFRIAQTSSLFRLIGFYVSGKSEFMCMDAFTKRGKKLSGPQRERIARVAKIKKQKSWVRQPS